MHRSSDAQTSGLFLKRQQIIEWAEQHYRCRIFRKDERIPTRPGLVYFIVGGAVRLVALPRQGMGTLRSSPTLDTSAVASGGKNAKTTEAPGEDSEESEEAFLGFVSEGQPFEVLAESTFGIDAYAHVDRTCAIWMYWDDLDNWSMFRQEVLEAFRAQHQRKLLWLGILGQRRTIDRLLGVLTLLLEEHGQPCDRLPEARGASGCCLPWSLTHAQIGSAIGSTRVTVTRLMGKLRATGLIRICEGNLISMPLMEEIGNGEE